MRIGTLVLYVFSVLAGRYAVAQDRAGLPAPGSACIDLNQSALNDISAGRLRDAESVLSTALVDPASGSERQCRWLILHSLACVMALSGRLVEAEVLEKRSLGILEKGYPPGDPVLLGPLESLAQIQLQQREIASFRKTFERLQSIVLERPTDRAKVHGLAAALLYAEGRYHEGEAEYLKALDAWEETGRGETSDMAAVLGGLATLYVAEGRYRDAGRILDRASAILASAKDAVATDWVKLLSTRAELHVRQREWPEAAADLRAAVSAADRDTQLDSAALKLLLANYAYVLRKSHRGKEARPIEARAAAIQARDSTTGVVDISELLAKSRND